MFYNKKIFGKTTKRSDFPSLLVAQIQRKHDTSQGKNHMANTSNFHESLDRANVVESGTNRSFGIVFAIVFALIALFPLVDGSDIRVWALAIAAAFSGIAFIAPGLLGPLNLLWARFGKVLHSIVTPIILGVIFFAVVTPMAIFFKILGKDPMRLRFGPNSTSFWIKRAPEDLEPESMKNQF